MVVLDRLYCNYKKCLFCSFFSLTMFSYFMSFIDMCMVLSINLLRFGAQVTVSNLEFLDHQHSIRERKEKNVQILEHLPWTTFYIADSFGS